MCKTRKTLKIDFSTKKVNREFRIKVYGCGVNTLVGVSGLIDYIGIELANKLVANALECDFDYHRKLRRGLKVSFYWK